MARKIIKGGGVWEGLIEGGGEAHRLSMGEVAISCCITRGRSTGQGEAPCTREKLLFSQSGMIERCTGPLEESLSQIRTTWFAELRTLY